MLLGERGKKLLATVRQNKIRRSLCHILHFEKGGRPVEVPDHVTFEGAAKWHKSNGVLHPDSLLSSLAPYEEVIVPGVSFSGWVRRSLSKYKMADAFDLS
eukprot:2926260-Ditylum_brightwellii.AAC.1